MTRNDPKSHPRSSTFQVTALALALGVAGAAGYSDFCPGSSAKMYAGCEVALTTQSDCGTAQGEVLARIAGQYDQWHGGCLLLLRETVSVLCTPRGMHRSSVHSVCAQLWIAQPPLCLPSS